MAKNFCILYPEAPNGEDSQLYKDLLKSIGDRSLVNWLYATYKSSNTADIMTQNGYAPSPQGEHTIRDVWKFLNVDTLLGNRNKIFSLERRLNIKDNSGKLIDYSDAEEALKIAQQINQNYKGLVATIIQHGDSYNVHVAEESAKTSSYFNDVESALKTWNLIKEEFTNAGIDMQNIPEKIKSVFSAHTPHLIEYISFLVQRDIDYLYEKDALLLFHLNPNSPFIPRLVSEFGSLEEAAKAIDDINHGVGSYTRAQLALLKRAIIDSRKIHGVDLNTLQSTIDNEILNLSMDDPNSDINTTLQELDNKYKINTNEVHKTDNKINSLSEAAIEAIFVLTRKIRELEKQQGTSKQGRHLEGILKQLMSELNNKKYYSGLLSFLQEASTQVGNIKHLFDNIPKDLYQTKIDDIFSTMKTIQSIKEIKDQYYDIANALATGHITIDEAIGSTEIDAISKVAKEIKEYFDSIQSTIDLYATESMIDMMQQIVGNKTPDGQPVANAIRMAAKDANFAERFYSVGRASNPVVAAMGSIIRDAQDKRSSQLAKIQERVRKATAKLYSTGEKNTEFMYEDEGHIISDIDWSLYKGARTAHIKSLYAQGLRGFDLKEAIELWEEDNTEERVVDTASGRTERVPNYQYRKDFPNLTSAQKEYYDTMMQIKGEVGTLLPNYAQHHYLPPQCRRNMFDAFAKAKNSKDVWKAVKTKVKSQYTIREDDTDYSMNGIIDGNEYIITNGAFDNTPLKEIPIFYINRVEQGELLKDFSAGVQALAGTAINYSCMNEVVDVVEFIGDFIKEQSVRDDTAKVDIVSGGFVRVAKDLFKRAKSTNTSAIVDGFIAQHIYGQKVIEGTEKKYKRVSLLKKYTSILGMSTNWLGAAANITAAELQTYIEAGAGEFFGVKDFLWARKQLLGKGEIFGDFMELATNNVTHKSVLLSELFDPINDNFSKQSHQRYHSSLLRKLLSHDLSFIGYSAGDYVIRYTVMYAMLHKQKVKLGGKIINLYDAFETTETSDSNKELKLKDGVTTLKDEPISEEWLRDFTKKLRGVSQSITGAMNDEDKGIIHRHWLGGLFMQFRQWMVEYYSKRYRKRHFDASLGMDREGSYVSLLKFIATDKTISEADKGKLKALILFAKDTITIFARAKTSWHNLDDIQKSNVRRVIMEISILVALFLLELGLGEPEDSDSFWKRFFIYQVKRMKTEVSAATPSIWTIDSILTMVNSPISSVNTLNHLLYPFWGISNGDINSTYKRGPHKGENKYLVKNAKYLLPGYKNWWQFKTFEEDEAIFTSFENRK